MDITIAEMDVSVAYRVLVKITIKRVRELTKAVIAQMMSVLPVSPVNNVPIIAVRKTPLFLLLA
jgi:hypothetical protein